MTRNLPGSLRIRAELPQAAGRLDVPPDLLFLEVTGHPAEVSCVLSRVLYNGGSNTRIDIIVQSEYVGALFVGHYPRDQSCIASLISCSARNYVVLAHKPCVSSSISHCKFPELRCLGGVYKRIDRRKLEAFQNILECSPGKRELVEKLRRARSFSESEITTVCTVTTLPMKQSAQTRNGLKGSKRVHQPEASRNPLTRRPSQILALSDCNSYAGARADLVEPVFYVTSIQLPLINQWTFFLRIEKYLDEIDERNLGPREERKTVEGCLTEGGEHSERRLRV